MEAGFETYGFPDGKRYNSFVGYFKRRYGERLQKIVLDAGFTCRTALPEKVCISSWMKV